VSDAPLQGRKGDAVPRFDPAAASVPGRRSADSATARADEVVVDVRGLAKSFGGLRAVDGLTMSLARGRITALVGPNGAGKTTVFNLITGALSLDAGRVSLFGQDITGMRPDEVTKRGMVRSFQDVRVFPRLTVLENVVVGVPGQSGERMRNLFLRPRRVRRDERAARARAIEWLDFIQLADLAGVRAGTLGYGQQKLLALARLLATEAEVLLLDEPASGIDYQVLDDILETTLRLRDAGRTICIVEHNLDVVGRLADHVYFMELGRVTAQGSFEQMVNDPRLAEVYFGAV
jgi:branched-chain amino acid transport system permease protein